MVQSRDSLTIGFAGLSHLGIVSSICWASLGWKVVAADQSAETVAALIGGEPPIFEAGLSELLKSNQTNLEFTTALEALQTCGVVHISLDVASDDDGLPALSGIYELIDQILPDLKDGVSLVVMSQAPVGFTRRLEETIRERRPELSFELYYWVETLVIGNGVERCLNPERIIIGSRTGSIPGNADIESVLPAFGCPVFRMSYESAELTKAAINTCLAVSVSVANALADLCEVTGAQMREIVPALRSDRRIGQYAYINPGLGIAGGNLERDLIHLQQLGSEYGAETTLIDSTLDYNSKRYSWAKRQLDRYVLPETPEPMVAFWGLSYKKGTESIRNSFAVRLLRELAGSMELRAYDPMAELPADLRGDVSFCDRIEAIDGADCLMVLTDWDEFSATDFAKISNKMRGKVIIDCVGILDHEQAEQQGFQCVSVGNPGIYSGDNAHG